jgi:hypothetical protein
LAGLFAAKKSARLGLRSGSRAKSTKKAEISGGFSVQKICLRGQIKPIFTVGTGNDNGLKCL